MPGADNGEGEFQTSRVDHSSIPPSHHTFAPQRPRISNTQSFYSGIYHPRPRTIIQWRNWQCSPLSIVGPRASPLIVSRCQVLVSPRDVIFRDLPPLFPGNCITMCYNKWKTIVPGREAQEVLSFIRDGVDVWRYFQPFKGTCGTTL